MNIIDEYTIQHNRCPKLFKVCDTTVDTMKLNKMSYRAVKKHLNAIGYEVYYNKQSRMRLRLKEK